MEFWINIMVSMILAAAGWAMGLLTARAAKVAGIGTAILVDGDKVTITTLPNSIILEMVAFVGCMCLRIVGLGKKHTPSLLAAQVLEP